MGTTRSGRTGSGAAADTFGAMSRSPQASELDLATAVHPRGDGTTFDAEDVKFSLDRARAEDSANAQKALFTGITDVTVIDPLTVQVTLAIWSGVASVNPWPMPVIAV